MAAVQVRHDEQLFKASLALMLALSSTAQFTASETLGTATNLGLLNGGTVQSATPITRENFKSDPVLCGSQRIRRHRRRLPGLEIAFFSENGELRDWVLTDFRPDAIPYPPRRNPGRTVAMCITESGIRTTWYEIRC